MRLHGLGMLGMSDTDVLQPGTVISFTVYGNSCSSVSNQQIADALNNWASQMMSVVSISTNLIGYVPTVVNVTVTATVQQAMPAGDLRGQIISALDAFTQAQGLNCHGIFLQDNMINVASGTGGGGVNPTLPPGPSAVPWSTTTALVAGAAAILGIVILTRR